MMARIGILAFLLSMAWLTPVFAQQKDVIVTAEPDQYAAQSEPINVQITVTHDQNEKVDESSFKMEGKPLTVKFVKEVKFSEHSNLLISIYSFSLPPQKKGLNFLKPITVNVGGKSFRSDVTTYQVGK